MHRFIARNQCEYKRWLSPWHYQNSQNGDANDDAVVNANFQVCFLFLINLVNLIANNFPDSCALTSLCGPASVMFVKRAMTTSWTGYFVVPPLLIKPALSKKL
jgi:hypothetical protein